MNFSSLEHKFKLKFEVSWNFELQFWINQCLLYGIQDVLTNLIITRFQQKIQEKEDMKTDGL
jgi:hypothetical protein